jgi:hypothetical protein
MSSAPLRNPLNGEWTTASAYAAIHPAEHGANSGSAFKDPALEALRCNARVKTVAVKSS